ncbi:MAG TPA: hypothetical protein VGD15_14345 [Kribbella sp.]
MGVLVWLGRGVGLGDRVARRLGAVVDRVGVGAALGVFVGLLDGVALGVALGVAVGVALGVAVGVVTGALASSAGDEAPTSVTTVNGSLCPVAAAFFASRVTYQPPAASTPSTARAPMIGPATPRRRLRLPCPGP